MQNRIMMWSNLTNFLNNIFLFIVHTRSSALTHSMKLEDLGKDSWRVEWTFPFFSSLVFKKFTLLPIHQSTRDFPWMNCQHKIYMRKNGENANSRPVGPFIKFEWMCVSWMRRIFESSKDDKEFLPMKICGKFLRNHWIFMSFQRNQLEPVITSEIIRSTSCHFVKFCYAKRKLKIVETLHFEFLGTFSLLIIDFFLYVIWILKFYIPPRNTKAWEMKTSESFHPFLRCFLRILNLLISFLFSENSQLSPISSSASPVV